MIVAAWLLASGWVYALTRLLRTKPAFDRLLSGMALATGLGTLGTLIPDLITSSLRALGVIDEQAWELSIATHGAWFWFTWATLATCVVLFAIGYPLAVKRATGASWLWAIAIGLAGFLAFQGFEYVFIR